MSLLIKALDKAQAEKVQAKSKAAKKSAAKKAKSEKSSKRSKRQKNKPTSASITLVEEGAPLSLSVPEEQLTSGRKVESNDIPAALKGSAADVAKKEPKQQPKVLSATAAVQSAPKRDSNQSVAASPAQAANVFAAKGVDAKAQNAKLTLIAVTSLIIIFAIWVAYYLFVDSPEIVVPPRPLATQEMPAPLPSTVLPEEAEINFAEEIEPVLEEVIVELDVPASEIKEVSVEEEVLAQAQDVEAVERTLKPNEVLASAGAIVKRSSPSSQLGNAIASDSASIEVTQKKQAAGVDPVLMRAYEAYRAGNDNEAQQGYKKVLQRYRTNVDAMLGLGAIAARQGRIADANDWYRRVLSVEPRNNIAQAALLDTQQQNGAQADESQIKSMIASDPANASLHATLGSLYAEQSQWPKAQQAYFDAYRLNANVDNAFNLGISLDQMGKSKLALPYYQEALSKAGQSSVIDAAGLEARITSIQQAVTN